MGWSSAMTRVPVKIESGTSSLTPIAMAMCAFIIEPKVIPRFACTQHQDHRTFLSNSRRPGQNQKQHRRDQ
jgi:hypothetical protein